MTEEKLQKLKNLFYNDKFATEAAGIELIDAGVGYARCEMEIKPIHLNAAGTVMGGATFTLADFTFAVASNYECMNTQSLTSQITFHSVPKGSRLISEAKCVKSGRSTCYYVITITDDLDRLVATVNITGFIKR